MLQVGIALSLESFETFKIQQRNHQMVSRCGVVHYEMLEHIEAQDLANLVGIYQFKFITLSFCGKRKGILELGN